jgi:hypothetical protein
MKLQTWGWMNWDAALGVLGEGASGLWLGPSEVCCGPLPKRAPDTDRIHAWTDAALWRLRLDADQVLVTALAEVRLSGSTWIDAAVAQAGVAVWSQDFVGELDCPSSWIAYDVAGVSRLRFLRPE